MKLKNYAVLVESYGEDDVSFQSWFYVKGHNDREAEENAEEQAWDMLTAGVYEVHHVETVESMCLSQ